MNISKQYFIVYEQALFFFIKVNLGFILFCFKPLSNDSVEYIAIHILELNQITIILYEVVYL